MLQIRAADNCVIGRDRWIFWGSVVGWCDFGTILVGLCSKCYVLKEATKAMLVVWSAMLLNCFLVMSVLVLLS